MRKHQRLISRELDHDRTIAHTHPYGSAPTLDHLNLLVSDLAQTHRGSPPLTSVKFGEMRSAFRLGGLG